MPAATPAGAPGAAAAPTGTTPAVAVAPPVASAEEAQSVLDFLDEITQRSTTPIAPVKAVDRKQSYPGGLSRSTSKSNLASSASRKSGESVRSRSETPLADSQPTSSPTPASPAADGGWGWSSVWNQASSVVQQAGAIAQQAVIVAEEQVKTASASTGGIGGLRGGLLKALGENEQAKKWGEGVIQYARGAHLDQIGTRFSLLTNWAAS